MRLLTVAVLALVFALACIITAGPSRADWPLDKMNEQIEKTNVIVSDQCSGTIVDIVERLVLTAYHCITSNLREVEKKEIDPETGAIKITKVQEREPMFIATWKRQDYDVVTSEKHVAQIKGQDMASDTALLQVIDKDWKPEMASPLAGCDYNYQRGKVVFAVGNPMIAFDNSITTGIISAPQRKVDFGDGRKIPLFQHSASTTGGNSGGAVYDENGVIIGTTTGGAKGVDISLSVPVCFAREMIKKAGFGKILEAK